MPKSKWRFFASLAAVFVAGILAGFFFCRAVAAPRSRQTVSPLLVDEFGTVVKVAGTVRGDEPRRKAYDERRRLIEVHAVNDVSVAGEKILELDALTPLPVGKQVELIGYETIRQNGFPDTPGEVTIQHEGYSIVHVFKVLKSGEIRR